MAGNKAALKMIWLVDIIGQYSVGTSEQIPICFQMVRPVPEFTSRRPRMAVFTVDTIAGLKIVQVAQPDEIGQSTNMTHWKTETDFTTIEELHRHLQNPPSQYHDAELASTEQEILEFFKDFGHFLNVVSRTDVSAGKRFFDMKDYAIWDIMGTLRRPNLEPHYDHITPYLGHTNQKFRDVEIVAMNNNFGYITANQNVNGTAADGTPYDFTYRSTSIVHKKDGAWKYVHEHYSFPVDMATKMADTTCSQVLSESVEFKKKSN